MTFIGIPTPDTKAASSAGVLILSMGNPELLERWARGLKEGTKLRVEIVPYSPARSDPQNKLFHALVGEIARETGMDADLIKEGLKEQYCPQMAIPFGDRMATVPKPTHLLSVVEMKHLIDGTIAEAIEAGVDVSPFLV